MHLSSSGPAHTLSGACHCGAITLQMTSTRAPKDLAVRECQCTFCRRHGARTVTDPGGHVIIRARRDDVRIYQFATRQTDFVLCRHCSVYVAAMVCDSDSKRAFATVSSRLLAADFSQPATPVSYDGETAESRLARRLGGAWTPAELQLS